jgi:flavin-dependent dehydrogenase
VLADVGLGDLAWRLHAVPLHGVRLSGWGRTARVPLRGAAAVSRAAFDLALVDAARAWGVRFLPGARARLGPVTPGGRQVALHLADGSRHVEARVVVTADGLGGSVLGHDAHRDVAGVRAGSRVGLGATFSPGPASYPPGTVHMAVAPSGYVGLVRLEDGSLNVAAAVDPSALRDRRASPGSVVASILRRAGLPPLTAEPSTPWRGTPALTRSPAVVGAERVFRVGDSAGYVEPFTGEGICWALSSARAVVPLVVRAAQAWDPCLVDRWRVTRNDLLVPGQRLSRALAWALRRPRAMTGVLALLEAFPAVAGPFAERAGRPPLLAMGEHREPDAHRSSVTGH